MQEWETCALSQRYEYMEKPSASYLASHASIAGARAIDAPTRHEGIGNALRVAFDPGSYGLPEDLVRLLGKIDG